VTRPLSFQPDEWLEPTYRVLRAALHDPRRLPLAASHMAGVRRCLRLMIESGALIDDDSDPMIACSQRRLIEIMAEAQRLAEHYEGLWTLPPAPIDAPLSDTIADAPPPEPPAETAPDLTPEPPQPDHPLFGAHRDLVAASGDTPPEPPPAAPEGGETAEVDVASLIDLLARGPSGDGRTPFIVAPTGPQSVYRLLKARFDLETDACDLLLRLLADRGAIVIESRGLPPHGRVRRVIRVASPTKV